jgi:hypothetical protein
MLENIQTIKKEGWIALAIGLPLAIFVYYIQYLRFIMSYVNILVHELGHAFFSWIFGFWAVPAFDFTYGGGKAPMNLDDRYIWVLALVYFGLIWLFYMNRKKIIPLILIVLLTLFYTLCAFTSCHKLIILFMGHGTELVFAGIFFYRAISGTAIVNDLERPLYAMLAFFIEIKSIMFGIKLLTDPVERIMYEQGMTTGGDANDFTRIAGEFFNNCNLNFVVLFFLLCCLIPPIVSLFFHVFKEYILE